MKKPTRSILAMLAIAALVPTAAAAQTRRNTGRVWNAGLLGGVTVSGIHTTNGPALGKVVGAQAGVFADTAINRNVGVRGEVLVTQRGARNDSTSNNMRIAYLDVPLMVRVGPTSRNDLHFHAFTGLTPGFKLKVSTTTGGALAGGISTDVKDFDLGWLIGAGVEQHALSFDARFTLGLVNVNNVPTQIPYKNRSFSANVGFRF